MAFAAVISGMLVSIAACLVTAIWLVSAPLAAVGLAIAAGQTAFMLVLCKALLCRSLQRARQSA
ncbi:MAG: hypothetical protein QNJ13_17130 [Paracoccaceae bacterium]|nr:hypothetical protein [Paracoccaceae bacterium]